jgi:DNA-binding HxlR family transcriptional regulator
VNVTLEQIRAESAGAFEPNCPSRTVLDHVMSKWGVLVLVSLTDGTARWGALRRTVEGISDKMLASTLRTLEADGLVERTAYPEVPPRVEYTLTPLGEQLMERMMPLMQWVLANADAMVGAGRAQPASAS